MRDYRLNILPDYSSWCLALLVIFLLVIGCGSTVDLSDSRIDPPQIEVISIDLGSVGSPTHHRRKINVVNNTRQKLSAKDVKTGCGCLSFVDGQADILPNRSGAWDVDIINDRDPGIFRQNIDLFFPDGESVAIQPVHVSGCTVGHWVKPTAIIISRNRPGYVAVCITQDQNLAIPEVISSENVEVKPIGNTPKMLRLVGLIPEDLDRYEIVANLFEVSIKSRPLDNRPFVSFLFNGVTSGRQEHRVPISVRN